VETEQQTAFDVITAFVCLVIWIVGAGIFAVMAIPSMPFHTRPTTELLTTVAQVDVGLLIAMAVERAVVDVRDVIERVGTLLSALSLALALTAISVDMGSITDLCGPLAIAGTYGAIVYLLARLIGVERRARAEADASKS
jgi:hypothetical protein